MEISSLQNKYNKAGAKAGANIGVKIGSKVRCKDRFKGSYVQIILCSKGAG